MAQLNVKPLRLYGQLAARYALPAASTAISWGVMSPMTVEYTSVAPSALSFTTRSRSATYMLSALSTPMVRPMSLAFRYEEYVSTGAMTSARERS